MTITIVISTRGAATKAHHLETPPIWPNQGLTLEDAHTAKSGYQAAAPSWYAYKDLCSNTMICDKQGPKMNPYYATICDSSGENAFAAQPVCLCPFSRANHSRVRAWG